MLIVQLIGGLGNQLFQYAAARALAEDYRVELKLDVSRFERYPLRKYLLHHLRVTEPLAAPGEIARYDQDANRLRRGVRGLLRRLRPGAAEYVTVRERGFPFQKLSLDPRKHTYLIGHWPSEKYFISRAGLIRAAFTLKDEPYGRNREFLQAIERPGAVSLHVRRGDYVSDPGARVYHGALGLDYYAAAIQECAAAVKDLHFFVFSDDLDWTRRHLVIDHPHTLVDANDAEHPQEDLRLMSRCRHHIIANSSLSWWGAWLNPRADKIVIAPRRWFGPGAKGDARDIVPPEWRRL